MTLNQGIEFLARLLIGRCGVMYVGIEEFEDGTEGLAVLTTEPDHPFFKFLPTKLGEFDVVYLKSIRL